MAASHIPIKKDQDRSLCMVHDQYRMLALCDGIGEFKDSGRVADLLIEAIRTETPEDRAALDESIRTTLEGVKSEGLEGGTTLLCCYQCGRHKDDELSISHLGNGAILHLAGDFHQRGPSQVPYRIRHLILPHVDEQGVLVRHVSHSSGVPELALSNTTLRLNAPTGDILLLVTDGIATLEEEMVIKDPSGTHWRLQSASLQHVLEMLHGFLSKDRDRESIQKDLEQFVMASLMDLKTASMLEDDASLGIVITDAALAYYHKQRNY